MNSLIRGDYEMAQDYKKFWDEIANYIPKDRGVFENNQFEIPRKSEQNIFQAYSNEYGNLIWKMWVSGGGKELKCVLFICRGYKESKELYYKLAESKEQINRNFSEELEWDPKEGINHCTISIKKSISNIWDESQWAEYANWLIENMIKLEEVFREPLAKAFESFPNIQKQKGRRGMLPVNHADINNTTLVNHNTLLGYEDEPKNDDIYYSKAMFLEEVFMTPEKYATLIGLLLRKKNIILQGAPGVGKTFAAQRLAFSIMGKKDTERVKIVQFHQSYSYEDFVMGYRPNGESFSLFEGPFYSFCRLAKDDSDHPYFFIIDEINRGNLSKIFGELLMLIEADKRGDKHAIHLLYKDEPFSVPENVYIIGMMNTADRSLAIIDYALRRRFSFFDMEPAFQSQGFKKRQAEIRNLKLNSLVLCVEALNTAISEDASLGIGFRIGHSYFCTNDIIDSIWLRSVVDYELIPLLNEYWFDEPSKIEEWSIRLRSTLNE